MHSYIINQIPNTSSGNHILSCVLGGVLMFAQLGPIVGRDNLPVSSAPAVRIERTSKTFSHYANMFTEEYNTAGLDFETTVASFYAQFMAEQEPLGAEFERVLEDNLWDLLVLT